MKQLVAILSLLMAPQVAGAQSVEKQTEDPVLQGVQLDDTVILGSQGQTRVVNGIEAPPDKYPFMTFLSREIGQNAIATCGGARIAPEWVLTAAHCVVEAAKNKGAVEARSLAIRQGSNRRNTGPKIDVAEVFPHPDYNSPYRIYNDIALLRLATPLQGAVVRLPVGGIKPRPFMAVNVVGWGKTAAGKEGQSSKTLREGRTKLVTRQACAEVHSFIEAEIKKRKSDFTSAGPIDQTRICAEVQNKKKPVDTCQGDSGGPLVAPTSQGFVAMGIVSYSYGCALPGLHAVYTNIAHYMPWIEEVTGVRFDAPAPKPITPKPNPESQPAKPEPVKPAPPKPTPVLAPGPEGDPEMEITSIEGDGNVSIRVRGGTTVAPKSDLVFEVVSSMAGRLQILDIGSDGTVNNIFPNTRTTRGRIPGEVGVETLFVTPTRQHGFKFRAPGSATERLLVAIVMKDADTRHAQQTRAGPVASPDKFLKETVQRLRSSCEKAGTSCAIGATRLIVR